ncbi:hypothetical protein M23134_06328 [Microscilla marina ATCC 23134]|uniref:Uncharacterized protein n=1 Tax=Microscilla marina ATCC 23134 TaxID=313606 RepID=A1ZZE5_MICM2|nr:hypothetical protein M23134_06328 [Microscilla marina ATCC 23134]
MYNTHLNIHQLSLHKRGLSVNTFFVLKKMRLISCVKLKKQNMKAPFSKSTDNR